MECLDHRSPSIDLTIDRPSRLGPGETEAPLCRVEAFPDYKNGKVRIKNLGVSKCLLNFTQVVSFGEEVAGYPGDIIDLTFDTYLYRIQRVDKRTVPVPEEPLSVEERESRLQIVLQPQLSVMISDDSTLLMVDSKNDYDRMTDSSSSNFSETSSVSQQSSAITVPVIPPQNLEWQTFSSPSGSLPVLVYGKNIQNMKRKVMGFDLDGTLVVPVMDKWAQMHALASHGKLLPVPTGLWQFSFDNVKETLTKFFATHPDHKFLIVTNKANINFEISKVVMEQVVRALDIPVIVFTAKEGTQFLKPSPSCWENYRKHFNEGVDPIWKQSFFCGDSAGRPNDHSKADRLFALNNGLVFKTPEAFFKDAEQDESLFEMPSFIPKSVLTTVLDNSGISYYPTEQEMIVMCGPPGSGKSWFVQTTLVPKGYVHIHGASKMHTTAFKKETKAVSDALGFGNNVVVDKRNADKDERLNYIQMANALKIPVRCFLMNVTPEQALHNLRFQEIRTGRYLNPSEIELGMKRYKGLYQPPTTDEGFFEVVLANFLPQTFLNHAELALYSKFLIPK